MAHHLYLSMIPEALLASMHPPQEFAAYLAVVHGGTFRERFAAMGRFCGAIVRWCRPSVE